MLEGSRRDGKYRNTHMHVLMNSLYSSPLVLTGEEIAAIQEQGASQQQQQQELQLQLDNYEQLLDNMITGLEQTNIELKVTYSHLFLSSIFPSPLLSLTFFSQTQHSAIEESFTYFQQQQLMAES